MFCNFNCSSAAGLKFNEDAVFFNQELLVIVDAATGLNRTNVTDEVSDGRWFSKSIVAFLAEELSDPFISTADGLRHATEKTRAHLNQIGCRAEETYPSGSIISARDLDEEIELLSIGDCTAIVEFIGERAPKVVHDNAVTELDNVVIQALLKKRAESGEDIKKLLPSIADMLIANRAKRNKTGGYWILDPTGTAVPHAHINKYRKNEIKSITLMSDGFSCITSLDETVDYGKLLEFLKSAPAEELIKRVYSILEEDASFNKHPRFKIKDDASVIYAEVV